jgi:hypothetical protein
LASEHLFLAAHRPRRSSSWDVVSSGGCARLCMRSTLFIARRLRLMCWCHALDPTARMERVCIGGGGRSPDGYRSLWRGDGAAPSARST